MINKILVIQFFVISNVLYSADQCPEDPTIRCEFGEWNTKVEFLPESFVNTRYGNLEGIYWHVPNSSGFRRGCFASTQNLDLMGPGEIDVAVRFKGSFAGFISDIREIQSMYLFELDIGYRNEDGDRIRHYLPVKAISLGEFKKVGSDPIHGSYYYASSGQSLTVRIDRPIRIDVDATEISVSGCAVFPDVSLDFESITVETTTLPGE